MSSTDSGPTTREEGGARGPGPGQSVDQPASSKFACLLVAAAITGCHSSAPSELEIHAPTFDASRVRFARHSYSAVGVFADKHGDVIPYIDANADGRLDPLVEPSGRCDRNIAQCWLDRARIRMIQRTTDCPAASGTWLFGDVYDHDGRAQAATLCDDEGRCAEEHPNAFKDIASVKAIWFPGHGPPQSSRTRTLTLRTASEELRFPDLTLPSEIALVDLESELPDDLVVHATASQSIDMAAVWVMRGHEQRWSSGDQPASLKASGNVLEARVPQAVMESCAGDCDVFLQFAHVWRDDVVLSLGEVKQRVR